MAPVPVLIDCDPGIDDALALFLAMASPELDILAVTTVAGNVGLQHTTANAIRLLDFGGRADIPVAAGAERPLIRPARAAAHVHGETGLAGADLPPPARAASPQHAIDLMAQIAIGHPQPVTLIATGPLTNVALLAARHPAAAARIHRVVLMGGSAGFGNVTPNAEFNIWADPEAAARVFTSGLNVTMVGLDVTHSALLRPADAERLAAGGAVGRQAAAMLGSFADFHEGWEGAPIHDAVAVAEVIAPGMLALQRCNVQIDCGPLGRGRTVCDLLGTGEEEPNARVATAIEPGFGDWLCDRILRLD